MSNHIDPKIQEIERRHAAATPGPWQAEGKEIWRRGDGYSGENRHVYITDVQDWENRNFIANAWADEAYLLSEYKRLQEENDRLMKEVVFWMDKAETQKNNNLAILNQQLGQLVNGQVQVMKEALEWYGDRDNYIPTIEKPTGTIFSEVVEDCGEKAREALSHLKGE